MSRYYRSILAIGGGIDPDAEAFLTAAGIVDPTITGAIDTLVTGLKSNSLWVKMRAIYPMVGGTATTHKFNLKDPRDLDVAFRLTFLGGWNHSGMGAKPNGTNSFADTYFNFTTQGLNDNSSFMIYLTDNILVTAVAPISIGALDGGGNNIFLRTYGVSGGTTNYANYLTLTSPNIQSETDGFWLGTRGAAGIGNLLRNDNFILGNGGGIVANRPMYLGALNNDGAPSNYAEQPIGLAGFSEYFNNTEAANLYALIQTFQTTLGRQV